MTDQGCKVALSKDAIREGFSAGAAGLALALRILREHGVIDSRIATIAEYQAILREAATHGH